jgi:hypothetical protein
VADSTDKQWPSQEKKAFVPGAGCMFAMFVQPLNVSSSGPVAVWKQSRWIWVQCSEVQNPDALLGNRSQPVPLISGLPSQAVFQSYEYLMNTELNNIKYIMSNL